MARLMDNQKREKLAFLYMVIITIVGLGVIFFQLFYLKSFSNVPIYVLLSLFLVIVEFYSIVIWKISMTLSFSIVYTLILLFGLPVAIVTYGVLLFIIHMQKRRPLRLLFFTPAQHAVSLLAANGVTVFYFAPSIGKLGLQGSITEAMVFTIVYFLVNNVIVDVLLLLRPQHYSYKHWFQKNSIEFCAILFSCSYLLIMLVLGSQNRGIVDIFSFLFFYSPIVAISAISSIIVRLQKERNRLKALFSLTTELNRLLFSKQWRRKIERLFQNFIEVEATAFWVKVDDDWFLNHNNGATLTFFTLSPEDKGAFAAIQNTRVYRNREKETVPVSAFFKNHIHACIFAPLIVENQTIGMLAVGRTRSHSFVPEEVRSMATLANQMAVLLKNYNLISEQKKRLLLEERNRIAREVHDGVAQSLAGAVMKLETSQRLLASNPEKARLLAENSIVKLRGSLKEIRQSIYSLKPYPTERAGLRQAIKEKCQEVRNSGGPVIIFQEAGQTLPFSAETERVIYETIQEALQNSVKHAKAQQIKIRLVFEDEQVSLTIKDDGIGFSLVEALLKAREEPHYGILNMNEQADKIGGTLQIDSVRGEGTKIQLEITNQAT